jgi:hypothetical protein
MVTEAQRAAIADHLAYELQMLWASAAAMGQANRILNNCVVQSFALHARNLIDFFYTAPQKDDVVAAHFFSKPDGWHAVSPAIAPILATAKTRANKEISHLTYSRCSVAPEDKPWPATGIVSALDKVLAVFCEHADLLPDPVRILRYRELLP